jgi:hypothetical protein
MTTKPPLQKILQGILHTECESKQNHKWMMLVQELSVNTQEAIGIGKDFLSRIRVVQQLRERINKWDYMILDSSAQ